MSNLAFIKNYKELWAFNAIGVGDHDEQKVMLTKEI